MARNIAIGIDVGTHATKVAVCEFVRGEHAPRVLGIGESHSLGMRHGYIINVNEAAKSIKRAVAAAEKNSGISIKRAVVSICGTQLESVTVTSTAFTSKADLEITPLDILKAETESRESLKLPNKKIIDEIPVMYKIDGKEVLNKPEGMKGVKLEVKTLFITCPSQHLDDLVAAVALAGVEVTDVLPAPIAENLVVLSDRHRAAGCILINIGAETVSTAIFENGVAQAVRVFSIGSIDITNDIALGLKIPLEEAESIKTGALVREYPKKKLDQIVDARISDMFELIENYLKKIKRSGLLPAGAVITGGGANLPAVEEVCRTFLKLPTKMGGAESLGNKNKIRNISHFVALGLCLAQRNGAQNSNRSPVKKSFRDIKNFFQSIMGQLMP